MAWEKFKQTYPNGIFPGGQVDLNSLAEDSEPIETFFESMARGMLTRKERITWFADNRVIHEYIFDLINTPGDPYPASCLNVYGKKMVSDKINNLLLRDMNGSRNYTIFEEFEEGDIQTNGGFNYTGL